MKQLERLLLFQGNRCFFCDQQIPEGEASIEHLVASSTGGGNEDDNCVACCKTLNAALGHKSYKDKLRAILNHRGQFKCPRTAAPPAKAIVAVRPPAEIPDPKLQVVIADLRKRGTARPRRLATLRNTIAAAFQKQISEAEVTALLTTLRVNGHVVVNDEKVSYNLPAKGA